MFVDSGNVKEPKLIIARGTDLLKWGGTPNLGCPEDICIFCLSEDHILETASLVKSRIDNRNVLLGSGVHEEVPFLVLDNKALEFFMIFDVELCNTFEKVKQELATVALESKGIRQRPTENKSYQKIR
jgi:hypothetical protein